MAALQSKFHAPPVIVVRRFEEDDFTGVVATFQDRRVEALELPAG